MPSQLTDALNRLLQKYGVEPPAPWRLVANPESIAGTDGHWTLIPGQALIDAEAADRVVPLAPWRSERRFVELRRLVVEQTVAPLVMCRLARFTGSGQPTLAPLLYRMFDLCEWLVGERTVTVLASVTRNVCANVLARMANDVLCSIEVSSTLPGGSPPIDRHELIARRGVASDRAVDTQVPQSSVYLMADNRTETYTDTDAELFGLGCDEIALVRAAFEVLSKPQQADQWQRQHSRLRGLVRLAFESDRLRQRLAVEGV